MNGSCARNDFNRLRHLSVEKLQTKLQIYVYVFRNSARSSYHPIFTHFKWSSSSIEILVKPQNEWGTHSIYLVAARFNRPVVKAPPVLCPTMHQFVTEMCTFLLQNGALWDICPIHCGICETGLWQSVHPLSEWMPLAKRGRTGQGWHYPGYSVWFIGALRPVSAKSVTGLETSGKHMVIIYGKSQCHSS